MSVSVRRPGRLALWRARATTPPSSARRRAVLLAVSWLAVMATLVGADLLCLRLARLPVQVRLAGSSVKVFADGQTLSARLSETPTQMTLASGASGPREYQVDGTDNTNTFTESISTNQALQGNPYYVFLSWMRSSSLYSQWTDLRVSAADGTTVQSRADVRSGRGYAVRSPGPVTISVALERPEAPASLTLSGSSGTLAILFFDRNDRAMSLVVVARNGQAVTSRAPYFPTQPQPFVAELLDTLLRVLLWAWALVTLEVTLSLGIARLWRVRPTLAQLAGHGRPGGHSNHTGALSQSLASANSAEEGEAWGHGAHRDKVPNGVLLRPIRASAPVWARGWRHASTAVRRLGWCHMAAACLAVASLVVELSVALVQFQAQPHILDASAYYFQAKIFASGQLSAPAPSDVAAFQGPFMVVWNHRWFAQYPPATSAFLALGMLVHLPWIVEPLLGTAALIGVYVIGCQLYDRRTALLALGLLVISPFYVYQAASYLSHTVSLAAEVGYLAALLWFVRTHRARALALAGAALGVLFAARELDALLVGIVSVTWLGWRFRRPLIADWRRVVVGIGAGALTLGCGLALYLAYNAAQTGSPLLLPRTLFSSADRYGFGMGVGFYGQHTVAAGLVNLDQQLTSLMIDLFGWPFYMTLALIPLALIKTDGRRQWDTLWLAIAGVMTIAQVGYFYHGIYLGPRYLFDTLPALALLTARGLFKLVWLGRAALTRVGGAGAHLRTRWAARAAGALLLAGVVACSAAFYWPRQLSLYRDFSGLPASMPFAVATVYQTKLTNALVITDNWYVYNYVLWPLNDPDLKGSVLYAFAPAGGDISRLLAAYPSRQVYWLISDSQGAVQFVPVSR